MVVDDEHLGADGARGAGAVTRGERQGRHNPHPGEGLRELVEVEGLGEGARHRQTRLGDEVERVAHAAHEDDGDAGVERLDAPESADAAQAWHEEIHDDRARHPLLDLQEGLDAIGGGEDHEALQGEILLEQIQHRRIVVHAQDARKMCVHHRLPSSLVSVASDF